jgi:hypothetical protein
MAVVGGALMVSGGIANHSFLLSLLNLVGGRLSSDLGGIPGFVVVAALAAISLLISLGGLTVALGGAFIYAGHVTMGRTLIALGGGAGFLGLLISFGYVAVTSGFTDAVSHSVYWIGLVIAVVARRLAKGV